MSYWLIWLGEREPRRTTNIKFARCLNFSKCFRGCQRKGSISFFRDADLFSVISNESAALPHIRYAKCKISHESLSSWSSWYFRCRTVLTSTHFQLHEMALFGTEVSAEPARTCLSELANERALKATEQKRSAHGLFLIPRSHHNTASSCRMRW